VPNGKERLMTSITVFGSGNIGAAVAGITVAAEADVVEQYGQQLAGKTVIDPSNPVDFNTMDIALPQGVRSAAEELAGKLPDSKIIKALNTNFAATLISGTDDGAPTTVMAASDSADAKQAPHGVVEAAGLRFVDAGALKRASYMEASVHCRWYWP
jgi:8-hydroxy-5-deazaflavin:NADPH oxidoreductase